MDDQEKILKDLTSSDNVTKVAALQTLVKTTINEPSQAILDCFERGALDPDIAIRFWSKKALAKYKVEQKGSLKTDTNKDCGFSTLPIEVLLKKLETSPSHFVAISILEQVFAKKDPTCISTLTRYLKECKDEIVISYLVKNLGIHYPDKETLNIILPYLKHSDDRVVANCVEGIGAIDMPNSVLLISQMLKHKHHRVQANAAKALVKYDPKMAEKTLLSMLQVKDKPHFIIAACMAIKTIKQKCFLPQLIEIVTNPLIAESALEAIEAIGGEESLAYLDSVGELADDNLSKQIQKTIQNIKLQQKISFVEDGVTKAFHDGKKHIQNLGGNLVQLVNDVSGKISNKLSDNKLNKERDKLPENTNARIANKTILLSSLEKVLSSNKKPVAVFSLVFFVFLVWSFFNLLYGLSEAELKQWEEIGNTHQEAKQFKWAGISLEEAKKWNREKFVAEDAIKFKNADISADEAAMWKRENFFPKEAIQFKNADISVEVARKWNRENFSIEEAIKCKNAGISAEEAAKWKRENIGIGEMLKWQAAGILAEEASEWIRKEFKFEEVKQLKNAGISLEEAIESKKGSVSKEATLGGQKRAIESDIVALKTDGKLAALRREPYSNKIQKRGDLTYIVNEQAPFTGVIIYSNFSGITPFTGEITFKDGKEDGPYISRFLSGSKQREGHHKNGVLDGLCKVWDVGGQLVTEENYKNGIKDGLCKTWYNNGQLESEIVFKAGKQDAPAKKWYENGQQEMELTYKEGSKSDGLCKLWYENGDPKGEGTFKGRNMDEPSEKDDEEHDSYLSLSDLGVALKGRNIDGLYREWDKSGRLKIEENYKDGKREGMCKTWSWSGKLCVAEEWSYKEGIKKGGVSKEMFKGSTVVVHKIYDSEDKLKSEGSYNEHNEKDGPYKEYDAKGNLIIDQVWKDGVQIK